MNCSSGGAPTFYFEEPNLPGYISQWISLLPLIVHLASYKGYHVLVGELALTGKLTLSLLPKLGHLNGISRLLRGIPDFLDRASSRSDLSSTIWDVDWGSTFPCANGAARDFLTRSALRGKKRVIDIETQLTGPRVTNTVAEVDQHGSMKAIPLLETKTDESTAPAGFRRYQTLHVIEITKCLPQRVSKFKQFWKSTSHIVHIPLLLAFAILFVFLGAYGTAVTVLICIATQIACKFVPISRPPGYLRNFEKHEHACMLSAIHSNASTWYLYVGDRASIDWLLNKTMVRVETEDSAIWAWSFRVADYLQLLAMTFVAGNMNWDGVCLLAMLVVNAIFKVIWEYPAHWAALRWISDSEVSVEAHSFKLTGRVPMLGAIQLLCADRKPHRAGFMPNNVTWMDAILVPSLRRKVWAENLANLARRKQGMVEDEVLPSDGDGDGDGDWVYNNVRWAEEAYECIRKELRENRGEV